MANLRLDMPGQQFINELNDAIEVASLSGGPSGEISTILRTVSMQMQMGKIDTTGANEGYIARNTATSSDDNFNNYCHTILMLGIENCTVSSIITQPEAGESLTIFCYGYDSTNGGPLRYKSRVTDPSNIPANTCYIKIMLKNDNGFNVMRLLEVKVAGKPTFIKNITLASNTPQYFSFETSYPSTAEKDEIPEVYYGNDAALEPYMGAGGGVSINCYDNGFIVLPPNYHPQDAAVPLIVYCHNKDEFGWDSNVNSKNARIFSFLANNGYAVCDCYGLTSNHKSSVNAYYAPSYVSSIACLLKFIYANYNVRTDGIYVCGKSSGAFMSLLLPYLQGFKVRAAAGLSPVISPFIALRKTDDTYWNANFANLIWGQLNISKATENTTEYTNNVLGDNTLGNHIFDTYTAYLNIPLLRRYDALFKTINLTDEELKAFMAQYYIKNESNIDRLYSNLINDNGVETAAKNVIDNGKITTKCPVKLWCSEGDIDVAVNSKWFVKWCKDGGSPAYMRKLPAGTLGSGNVSSHDLVDTIGNNDLKISYTPKFGNSVYETIAICEMVDWFNQW